MPTTSRELDAVITRAVTRKPVKPPRRILPTFAGPSMEQLAALRHSIDRLEKSAGSGLEVNQARERRISVQFAAELRKRGWLTPENEGYAPGSWAAA